MPDLSVLIPSRNERFLKNTIDDLLAHAETDIEIIAVLDGTWPLEPIPDHPRVTLIYHAESIGQRAAANEAAKIAQSPYVMKVDAHCAFDQGFDAKLLADMKPNWTMVPTMRNLHAFDWVCPNEHRRYQGPSGPCKICGEPTVMDIVWIPKTNPQSRSYCFDSEPHFQYFREYSQRPEGSGNLTESMSLQGSCWLLTSDKYFELGVCDEEWGSWGSQGIEVALKTWLSGGSVIVNNRTWYAHMFRTQGGDFGFPYPLSGNQVSHAKHMVRKVLFTNSWPKQVKPLSWLLDKFWPIPGWSKEDYERICGSKIQENKVESSPVPKKTILYYTCNTHDERIEQAARKQLEMSRGDCGLVSVSLKPIEFGDQNIVLPLERSPLSMHRQILAGLESIKSDIVFLAESDVLYHPSHFDFTPRRKDVFYYNTNVWRVRYEDGHAVWTDNLQQVSGLCAYRELLLEFYRKRVAQIEKEGFNGHYEPGSKQNIFPYIKGGKYGTENRKSEYPNVDIRHGGTLTRSKWAVDEFRNPQYARGWREASAVEGWGVTEGRIQEFLEEIYLRSSIWHQAK